MKWKLVHQIFHLCFFQSTKALKETCLLMEKIIKASDTTELLGITLDKNIDFKRRIQYICHKANNKTKPLFRIRKFLNLEQTQVSAEAHISSNFRCCPLIWMFCGNISDSLITKTYYEALGAIYDTQTRSYEELLDLSSTKKMHT